MNKNTNITENSKTPNPALKLMGDFFGIRQFNDLINAIISFAKRDFQKFSVLAIALITSGAWLIRTFCYCYQSGIFTVYNISKNYIVINDNFLYQIIQFLGFFIIYLLINYIYVCIKTWQDVSPHGYKRKLQIVVFYIIEMFALFVLILIPTNHSIPNILNESVTSNFISIILSIIALFIAASMLNIIGIEVVLYKKKRDKNNLSNDSKDNIDSHNPVAVFFISVLIIVIIILPATYFGGIYGENIRKNFKIIQEPIIDNKAIDENYIFTFDNNSFILYPVIYENQEVYIVSRIYKDNNKIVLDKSFQKIINKQDIITYNIDNIYNIKTH